MPAKRATAAKTDADAGRPSAPVPEPNHATEAGSSRPRRQRKMAEVVAREILDEVLSSGLRPGDRLPAESVMLKQYDIGRSTLREALRILEVYGVLMIRSGPGGGPVLVDIRPRDIAQVMQLFLSVAGYTLGEVLESVNVLQNMLARQSAVDRDPSQVAELREIVGRAPGDDRREFHLAVSSFHHAIADVPGARLLRVIAESLEEMLSLQVGKQVDIHQVKENLHDHVLIVDAIEAGDAEQAGELMAAHNRRTTKVLRKSAPGALERRVEWT